MKVDGTGHDGTESEYNEVEAMRCSRQKTMGVHRARAVVGLDLSPPVCLEARMLPGFEAFHALGADPLFLEQHLEEAFAEEQPFHPLGGKETQRCVRKQRP